MSCVHVRYKNFIAIMIVEVFNLFQRRLQKRQNTKKYFNKF